MPGADRFIVFRVYNPETQAEKFDPDRAYRDRFADTPMMVRSGGYVIDGMFDLRGSWGAVRPEG